MFIQETFPKKNITLAKLQLLNLKKTEVYIVNFHNKCFKLYGMYSKCRDQV